MNKILAKALRDAVREKRIVTGSRQTLNSVKTASLLVCSDSSSGTQRRAVQEAQEASVPVVRFNGTSVALGRMCGLQFRVSSLSLKDESASTVQSIVKESEQSAQ